MRTAKTYKPALTYEQYVCHVHIVSLIANCVCPMGKLSIFIPVSKCSHDSQLVIDIHGDLLIGLRMGNGVHNTYTTGS